MPDPASTSAVPHSALPWRLAIFPVLEAGWFIASALLLQHASWLAAPALFCASISLSFGIHIFFHECVHRKALYQPWFTWPASILLGLPFDGYRVHHYNHHVHENGLDDFSTTWLLKDGRPQARSVWSYTFGWPRQLLRSIRCQTPFGGTPDSANRIKSRIPGQKKALLAMFIVLLCLGWQFFLLYLALIYFGWALTSLHNFGQHPPLHNIAISTFTGPWYNRLFFNNGLHWEHHRFPAVNWDQLQLHPDSPRITQPHILYPLFADQSGE